MDSKKRKLNKQRYLEKARFHYVSHTLAKSHLDYNSGLNTYEYRQFNNRPTDWALLEETYFELLDRAETYFQFN